VRAFFGGGGPGKVTVVAVGWRPTFRGGPVSHMQAFGDGDSSAGGWADWQAVLLG